VAKTLAAEAGERLSRASSWVWWVPARSAASPAANAPKPRPHFQRPMAIDQATCRLIHFCSVEKTQAAKRVGIAGQGPGVVVGPKWRRGANDKPNIVEFDAQGLYVLSFLLHGQRIHSMVACALQRMPANSDRLAQHRLTQCAAQVGSIIVWH